MTNGVHVTPGRPSYADARRIAYLKPAAFDTWFGYVIGPDPTTGQPTVMTPAGVALDVSTLRPAAGVTYYVGYTGASDSNNGLSSGASLLNLSTAVAKSDVGTVMLNGAANKLYTRIAGTFPSGPSRSVSILADGGTPTISAHDVLTWTLTSGATNTYQAARSAVLNVYDAGVLDANGDYTRLTQAGSYAGTGDLTAGQWYSNGTTVWVRTTDSRSLVGSTSIRVFLDVKNAYVTGARTLYLEGIIFEGGNYGLQAVNGGSAATMPTVVAKNCVFKYGGTSNAVTIQGATAWFQGCTAACAKNDGFNYHAANGVLCQAVEIACIGRHNGTDASDINNGSTTHDGNALVRVGGQYYGNNGPNLADVDSGTTSWNVGCGAWGSTAGTGAVQNGNYHSQCTGAGAMWLDSCWGYRDPASAARYQLVLGITGARLYLRNFMGDLNVSLATGSALVPY